MRKMDQIRAKTGSNKGLTNINLSDIERYENDQILYRKRKTLDNLTML